MKSRTLHIIYICLLAALSCGTAAAQDVVRATGQVVSKTSGTPLVGVAVADAKSNRLLANTDEDGRFAVNVRIGQTLRFSMIGAEAVTQKVKKNEPLRIEMEEHDFEFGEVAVSAKRIRDRVKIDPTTIGVRGNYFYVPTSVAVPDEIFSHDTRLVVQPLLTNHTRKRTTAMRPLVYDASEYNATQQRMYDRQISAPDGDPLAEFIVVKGRSTRDSLKHQSRIPYNDSIYVENANDEYTCDVILSIENYRRILYGDTLRIARGTSNPLRWLEMRSQVRELQDEAYFPKPEVQLHDSEGSVDFRFEVGKARLSASDAHNAEEMRRFAEQVEEIHSTPGTSIHSLTLSGTASPDGRYASNQKLATDRMQEALRYLRDVLPAETRETMTFSSTAEVASWQRVADMLRADGHVDEAECVEGVISQWSHNTDMQSAKMKRLSFYQDVLQETYLPRLRRVDYTIHFSIFRSLTDDEIKDLYNRDYHQLSRYEFFRLYRAESDLHVKEKYLRQALEVYPSFMVAASDLQSILLAQHRSDPELLARFAGKKAPVEVNQNHISALMENSRYADAMDLLPLLPETPETAVTRAFCLARNGEYDAAFETVSATSEQNHFAMLLATNKNKEAYDLSLEMNDDEALTHYFRATALNRLMRPIEADKEMRLALKLDAELVHTALVDADVNTIGVIADMISVNEKANGIQLPE